MKTHAIAALILAAFSAAPGAGLANDASNQTLRTATYFIGAAQRPYAQLAAIDYPPVTGANLVNLVMGRDVSDTNFPNQVLALTFPCDLSAADLVVYDGAVSNIVGVIASSTQIDRAYDVQTNRVRLVTGATNELARFVAMLPVVLSGNETNGLRSGYLTMAGRLQIDPASGCPTNVPSAQNRDRFDKIYAYKDVPKNKDKDARNLRVRTGLANMIGVIEFVASGTTNTVLVPLANLSISYILPGAAN